VKHPVVTRRKLKARRDRRGRPRKANAKRRATTLAERAPFLDRGTPELRHRRLAATGDSDLPDDLLGILYGHGVIDPEQYTASREFAALVRLVRLGFGLTEASPAGAWRNILTAAHSGQVLADFAVPGAERARRALARFRRALGSPSWRAALAAIDNVYGEDFPEFVVDLRRALDYLALHLPLPSKTSTG